MRSSAALAAAAALFVAVFTSVTASADVPAPSEEQTSLARQRFVDAVEAQEAGRYADALALYRQVSEVTMTPNLAYNIGACHEQLGALLEAEVAFERALGEATARNNEEVAAEARARLSGLRQDIPRLVVRLPPSAEGAAVTLDDVRVETRDLRVNPGTHRLVVDSERHTRVFAMTLELPLRSSRTIDVDLGPPKSEPAPVVIERIMPGRPGRSHTPALISGAGALALGAGAFATGLVAHDRLERFEALNAAPTSDNLSEREELRSSGHTMQVVNAVLLGTAVVAAGLSVYLFVRTPGAATRRASTAATF
jgi:tetratricopeptide (TPR) repeat protein